VAGTIGGTTGGGTIGGLLIGATSEIEILGAEGAMTGDTTIEGMLIDLTDLTEVEEIDPGIATPAAGAGDAGDLLLAVHLPAHLPDRARRPQTGRKSVPRR
jgi:hypothetical protein